MWDTVGRRIVFHSSYSALLSAVAVRYLNSYVLEEEQSCARRKAVISREALKRAFSISVIRTT